MADLIALQKLLGFPFPTDYLNFLERSSEEARQGSQIDLRARDGDIFQVHGFLDTELDQDSTSSIIGVMNLLNNEYDDIWQVLSRSETIPIAWDVGGNIFVLKKHEPEHWRVYYVYLDVDPIGENDENLEVVKVGNSFSEFLQNLI